MSVTTITVRGVDPEVWREFQSGIVKMHGNLYGNIGEEVTNALSLWLLRQSGKELAKRIPADHLPVSYDNIGGLKEEIRTMKETVGLPLRRPELHRWLGLIPAKAVLIHGPLGTGKNILARAAAAEAKAQLYVLSMQRMMNEPDEMKLRGVFENAKENAPSVILIPDLRLLADASDDTAKQIAGWLVSEIDVLEDFGRVIVIGISSSPEQLEVPLRQRFQKDIQVKVPDRRGRYEILKIQTSKMPLADDVSLERLADMTDRYSGVLLLRTCQEAATRALRRALEQIEITQEEIPQETLERIKVTMDDFEHAVESITP